MAIYLDSRVTTSTVSNKGEPAMNRSHFLPHRLVLVALSLVFTLAGFSALFAQELRPVQTSRISVLVEQPLLLPSNGYVGSYVNEDTLGFFYRNQDGSEHIRTALDILEDETLIPKIETACLTRIGGSLYYMLPVGFYGDSPHVPVHHRLYCANLEGEVEWTYDTPLTRNRDNDWQFRERAKVIPYEDDYVLFACEFPTDTSDVDILVNMLSVTGELQWSLQWGRHQGVGETFEDITYVHTGTIGLLATSAEINLGSLRTVATVVTLTPEGDRIRTSMYGASGGFAMANDVLPLNNGGFLMSYHKTGTGTSTDNLAELQDEPWGSFHQIFGGAVPQNGIAEYPQLFELADQSIMLTRRRVKTHEVHFYSQDLEAQWSAAMSPSWQEFYDENMTYHLVEEPGEFVYVGYRYVNGEKLAVWKINWEGEVQFGWTWEPEHQLSFEPQLMWIDDEDQLVVFGREVREVFRNGEWVEETSTTIAVFEEYTTDAPGYEPAVQPVSSRITSCRPNPFNEQVTVEFNLAENTAARLVLYDLLGREVWTETDLPNTAGTYSRVVRPNGVASGVYLLTLEAGAVRDTRKVIYLR
ncbi:T9SS type A sorting domain-containing protein [bacterium]|nr:T9SS type A sorting domain-containing protein [bacterium]